MADDSRRDALIAELKLAYVGEEELASLRAQLAAKEARIGELEKQVDELEDDLQEYGAYW